ncbi:MAG: hypothetical protein WC878_01480 [Candidatus Paceibacterota bacterium]|jgi:hypothetical protein
MKKKENKDYDFTVPVIVIVGLFVLTLLLNAVVMPKRPVTRYQSTAPVAYDGKEHLFIIDQKITDRIAVLSMALKQTGFVVVSNEATGNVVSVSPLLAPALYSNKAILLSAPVASGDELFATIYTDNGDGVFNQDTTDDVMESAVMWFTAL